jgi:hypothetical protein
MNSTTVPTGLTQAVAENEIASVSTSALTAADATSADRLDNLSLVQQARISQLSRTVSSLTAQYGAGSAQVATAQAALTAVQGIAARVQMLRQQTAASAPTVTASGWAVWGHVYDSNSNPLNGYCVFLVDSQKNYQNAYGFEFTDSTGSFAITAAAGASSAAATIPTVFLAITNANAQLVYVGSQALALAVGSALYVDTSLAAGAPVLGDLPAEIRKVAVPRTKK